MGKRYDILGTVDKCIGTMNKCIGTMDKYVEKGLYSIGRLVPEGARGIITEYRDVAWCGALAVCIPAVQDPLLFSVAIGAVGLETACGMTEIVEREKMLERCSNIDRIVEQEEAKPEEKKPEEKKERNSTPYPTVAGIRLMRYVISKGVKGDYHVRFDLEGEAHDALQTALCREREIVHVGTLKSRNQEVLRGIDAAVAEANETGKLSEQRLQYHIHNPPKKTPSNGMLTVTNSTKNTRRQPQVTDAGADTQSMEVTGSIDQEEHTSSE